VQDLTALLPAAGLTANYPWVVSTQLGTNVFFVNNVLGVQPCGYHATMQVGVLALIVKQSSCWCMWCPCAMRLLAAVPNPAGTHGTSVA